MSYIDDIAATLRQAGIDQEIGASDAVGRGWDYWQPLPPADGASSRFDPCHAVRWATTKPDTDGGGVARTSHRHLLSGATLPARTLPILGLDMDIRHLLAGIWRQCLVRPSDDGETNGDNPFLTTNVIAICPSSRHLMALVGHPPRDLALWYDDLRRRDAESFRLVVAKAFRQALARDPSLVTAPWPTELRSLWRADEGDRLPPFLVAVLYAELARAALNQAGLLALSFDGAVELTTKQLLERVGTHIGAGATVAAGRAIAHAPFQTLALGVPDILIKEENVRAISIWARSAAAGVALTAGIRGSIDIAPGTPKQAAFLRAGFAAHPQYQPEERKGKGFSFQPRGAATLWGLTWRVNAAVRLLEIADTAREWNRMYRPGGPPLPSATNWRSANPVACAIAAIRFRWTAEYDPASALTMLSEVLSKDEKKDVGFAGWTPDEIDPLTIDGFLGRKSGLTLLKKARSAMTWLPKPGKIGYTARSQAHLWLDNVGDDLERYRHYQRAALREHDNALAGSLAPMLGKASRIPDEVIALLARPNGIEDRRLNRRRSAEPCRQVAMTDDPTAASGAQLEGQRVSPFSTDPVWARLLRGKIM